ncbi:MAG: AAA family ATPase, partial [Legionella sp.]
RVEVARSNPGVFLQKIMQTHSVFTRRDIERLVFKTFAHTEHHSEYLHSVAEALAHHSVVHLGKNEHGIDSYTTHEHYLREGRLLNHVEQLYTRFNHMSHTSLDGLIEGYQLNDEQAEAINYIAKGCDISVLIGRPGVGKSYLLKPLKEHYEASNYHVLGTSLSGKVAKALQSETGIASSTIASLSYRLRTNQITLTKQHVLVVDEAGMVDVSNMEYLLESVNKVGAKIILVGDPDQLKPINKGEIFRGIAARIGYIELEQIRRQRDISDRAASLALAHGRVTDAINHYSSKGAIHFAQECDDAANMLIDQWQQNKTAESIKEHVILAFTKAAVESLNLKARAVLQEQELVGQEQYAYQSQHGAKKIALALGERILFRQNHKQLGVRNGELATITRINAYEFHARLDSGEQVIIPKSYAFIEYGYALTVHKSQGMTINHASVFVDSTYWDKNLAFVAMTRHRDSLNLYTSQHHHLDLKALTHTLSRTTTKDNVIDWPLDFAMRAGFEPDSLIGQAINSLTKAAHLIKDKWNYVVNYEKYMNAQKLNAHSTHAQHARTLGHKMAQLLDDAAVLRQQVRLLDKEAALQCIKQEAHPKFEALYQRSVDRDKQAAQLLREQKELLGDNRVSIKGMEAIKSYAARDARYQTLTRLAQISI